MAVAELGRPSVSPTVILAAVAVMGAIALAPGVMVRERDDGHAIGNHKTSAIEIIQRQPRSNLDVWYSRSRETALVVGCDCASGLCAIMVVGVRGHVLDATTFSWADLDKHLELTHYVTAAKRVEKTIARDGYVRVCPPVGLDVVPPVWQRCMGGGGQVGQAG